jgi:hypothetical protein
MPIKQINTDGLVDEAGQYHSYLTIGSVRKDIKKLKKSADEINLQIPDEVNWHNINHRLKISTKAVKPADKHTNIFMVTKPFLSLAATISFLFISWLSWNNYELQKQLEITLKINQGMELQLAEYSQPKLSQLYLLQEIKYVEDKLVIEQSLKNKIEILKERSVLMQKMLEYQQGVNHEFRI